jgi:hypothetical protein
MQNGAEWGKGAGKKFPEQLRVKVPPRFHEALPRGIGVQVQHDFNAQAASWGAPAVAGYAVEPEVDLQPRFRPRHNKQSKAT